MSIDENSGIGCDHGRHQKPIRCSITLRVTVRHNVNVYNPQRTRKNIQKKKPEYCKMVENYGFFPLVTTRKRNIGPPKS